MIRTLRNFFAPPSAHVMAARQLQEAERELLQAHRMREAYALGLNSADAEIRMLEHRIRRLADHPIPHR